jgi:NitT/TauT family transport system substrate-binding protein
VKRTGLLRQSILGTLASLTCLGVFLAAATGTTAADLKKVRLGVATTVLNINYPWVMMPKALGYWRDEGYDVTVVPVGGSLQVVQQMVGGGVDIGQLDANIVVQVNDTNNIPIRAFMANTAIGWAVSVPSGSSVKTLPDLKGKKIGVFNLASGGLPSLYSYLAKNGMSRDDVQLIPVGYGATAVQALKSQQVDALFFWSAANAGFENAGLSLRYLSDPEWLSYPDFSMAALNGTIQRDPKMIEAIARGAAKASVFAVANPDCVRKVQWATWPDTKPTGADEETLAKRDLNTLSAQLKLLEAQHDMTSTKLWGETDVTAFSRLQDFLKQAGVVSKTVPPSDLIIDDKGFFQRVNDFDQQGIIASAKTCDFK